MAVIIDTSDTDYIDTDDIVETSYDTGDAAETQDTANVTNKFMLYNGAENSLMLMILVLIAIMNKQSVLNRPTCGLLCLHGCRSKQPRYGGSRKVKKMPLSELRLCKPGI